MPRGMIFCMWHIRVDLYEVCTYDTPGVKTDAAPGVTNWSIETKTAHFKIRLL